MPRITTDVDACAAALRRGEVVAIPTETVYGLAGSIRSQAAIRRIFEVKRRPLFDPLIVHIADLAQKDEVARHWPDAAGRLAARFWPGPLTIVLPRGEAVDPMITAGLPSVGVRMPRHPMALDVIRAAGAPLAAPSANRFGRTSPTTAAHVASEFADEDLLILDGGPCEVGVESTVLSVEDHDGDVAVRIYRPGFVTREAIETELGQGARRVRIERATGPESPGQSESHYRPRVPLVIVDAPAAGRAARGRAAGALGLPEASGVEVRLEADPLLAARRLYAEMREHGASGARFMFVVRAPGMRGDAWDAVWDRLERAATRRI